MSTETIATSITPEQTINAIVERYPQALPVLQRFGLDTCCGGALPLATAAEHHGLQVSELLAALEAAQAEQPR